ncbi:hypothetical protein D3C84_752300 [compost metagenome]
MEQLDIGHAIAIAALRVAHVGFAAGVQVILGDGVLGAAELALGGVGGVVVGAVEEHADTQGNAQPDLRGGCEGFPIGREFGLGEGGRLTAEKGEIIGPGAPLATQWPEGSRGHQ